MSAKKTTLELRAGKGRMVDAEVKALEASQTWSAGQESGAQCQCDSTHGGVGAFIRTLNSVLKALVHAEAREKEALEQLAQGFGLRF